MSADRDRANQVISACRINSKQLFGVGLFDSGVTVLHQQTRALNLAWALVETSLIPTAIAGEVATGARKNVAIVGGGFAGLSVAAGLLRKGAHAKITIFEQRDTLFPLQQGSDTRWLHPHIYDWPADGSEANSAMLPVLNWTAARASDVVVQVSSDWKEIASSAARSLELYCNTRHLQISETDSGRIGIEWIGDGRDPKTGTVELAGKDRQLGSSAEFDIVVLATGFGLEKKSTISYWRNDTLGQPNLEQPRLTFYLCGQGDGAMIDLMRLKISHYRQDRILSEIFSHPKTTLLMNDIRNIYKNKKDEPTSNLFALFDGLQRSRRSEFGMALDLLKQRIRRDTEVILGLKVAKFSDLFIAPNVRMSFQNSLLAYFLYKCGAFFPTTSTEDDVIKQHSIPSDRVIRRIGIDRKAQLQSLLSKNLFHAIYPGGVDNPKLYALAQRDRPEWPGGYFGYSGRSEEVAKVAIANPERLTWRKEYLPGPTKLVATTLCASLAGALRRLHPSDRRLRITLHRAVSFGQEEVLQQSCDYFGQNVERPSSGSPSGRTFPAGNATIGLAYRTRQIVRSKRDVNERSFQRAMKELDLQFASAKMAKDVAFVLAIPVLEPAEPYRFIGPTPVSAVIYIDSTASNFFIEDDLLQTITTTIEDAFHGMEAESRNRSNRTVNVPLSGLGALIPNAEKLSNAASQAFELVRNVRCPTTTGEFQLNFEYTDFVPITA